MRTTLPSGRPAALAEPSTGEAVAGLVIIPDLWGLRPLFEDMAARLADENRWRVVVVEPLTETGLGSDPSVDFPARAAAMRRLDDTEYLDDIVAAADTTHCDRVGVIGFCAGGMYVLKVTARGRFDRAVAFYGPIRVPDHFRGAGHVAPLEAMSQPGATPVLAVIGGQDDLTPPDDVAALDAFEHVTIASYPDAGHGFVHDPSRPAHRPDDAADAWARAITFLGST